MSIDIFHIIRWKPAPGGRTVLYACTLATIIGATWVHYKLGKHYHIDMFFLLPVILMSWYGGRKAGNLFSLLSVAGWMIVDLGILQDSPFWAEFINNIFRFSVLLIVVQIASRLRIALDREHDMARQDTLTCLPNRRAFYEMGEIETERSRRYDRPFTALFFDLDNFKTVNDIKGHGEGDRLLKTVAEILHSRLRTTDICGRLGGDEFAVLLPETDEEAAASFAAELRARLIEAMERHSWPVTFSIGVATFNTTPDSLDQLIKTADALMYTVKQDGKNAIRHEVY
ncbi:MAG: diguanylate cyclase [Gammaproteobacteria bacterium]|nr:diguanylate cyclase [Gammaproteobacteria bacterium]MBU1980322.1 diguanylate cyclase [Gammaproteobacteria bacterium]